MSNEDDGRPQLPPHSVPSADRCEVDPAGHCGIAWRPLARRIEQLTTLISREHAGAASRRPVAGTTVVPVVGCRPLMSTGTGVSTCLPLRQSKTRYVEGICSSCSVILRRTPDVGQAWQLARTPRRFRPGIGHVLRAVPRARRASSSDQRSAPRAKEAPPASGPRHRLSLSRRRTPGRARYFTWGRGVFNGAEEEWAELLSTLRAGMRAR